MSLDIWQYFFIFVLVGFAGFIDAIAGGGGLITVPTYIIVGVPAEFILGTNKLVSTFGTTFAVWRFVREKLIFWRLAFFTMLMALMGSYLGAHFSSLMNKDVMIMTLILVVPVILFLQRKTPAQFTVMDYKIPLQTLYILKAMFISLVIGGYDGFFGPGTGTFLLIAFMSFLSMSPLQASANARVVNYASNVAALIFFMIQGRVLWNIALLGIGASFLGNWFGSGFVIRKSEKVIVPIFRFVLLLLLVKCVYDLSLTRSIRFLPFGSYF